MLYQELKDLIRAKQAQEVFSPKNYENFKHAALTSFATHTSQKYGPAVESALLHFLGLTKNSASDKIGDTTVRGRGNIEIKVGLLRGRNYGMTQIRPFHDIQYYLGVWYDYIIEDFVILLIPSKELYKHINFDGSRSHGTKDEQGSEYTLNMSQHTSRGKGLDIWKDLKKYKTTIEELQSWINSTQNQK